MTSVVFMAACSSRPTAGASSPSQFPTIQVTVSQPPVAFSCTAPPAAGEKLAVVSVQGQPGAVVLDMTNTDLPVTRCKFDGGRFFQFVSATRVSYVAFGPTSLPEPSSYWLGVPGTLYLADLATGKTSPVLSWTSGYFLSWLYAWSPDGKMLAYLDSTQDRTELHLLTASGDQMLSNLGTPATADTGYWPGFHGNRAMLGFSADGQYLALDEHYTYMVQGQVVGLAPPFQVYSTADRKLAYSAPLGDWAIWSAAGHTLRLVVGMNKIQSWDPTSGVQTVFPNTFLTAPSASSDGQSVVFSDWAGCSVACYTTWLLDNTTAPRQLTSRPAYGAAFLTPTLLWYADPVVTGDGHLTPGQGYVYKLSSATELPSTITGFYDSWPHVVGQS